MDSVELKLEESSSISSDIEQTLTLPLATGFKKEEPSQELTLPEEENLIPPTRPVTRKNTTDLNPLIAQMDINSQVSLRSNTPKNPLNISHNLLPQNLHSNKIPKKYVSSYFPSQPTPQAKQQDSAIQTGLMEQVKLNLIQERLHENKTPPQYDIVSYKELECRNNKKDGTYDNFNLPIDETIVEYERESSSIPMKQLATKKSNSLMMIEETSRAFKQNDSILSSAPSMDSDASITMPILHVESTHETSDRRKAIWKRKTRKLRQLGGKKRDKHFYRKRNKKDIAKIQELGQMKKKGQSVKYNILNFIGNKSSFHKKLLISPEQSLELLSPAELSEIKNKNKKLIKRSKAIKKEIFRKDICHKWGIEKQNFGNMRASAKNLMKTAPEDKISSSVDSQRLHTASRIDLMKSQTEKNHQYQNGSNIIHIEDSHNSELEDHLNKTLSCDSVIEEHDLRQTFPTSQSRNANLRSESQKIVSNSSRDGEEVEVSGLSEVESEVTRQLKKQLK